MYLPKVRRILGVAMIDLTSGHRLNSPWSIDEGSSGMNRPLARMPMGQSRPGGEGAYGGSLSGISRQSRSEFGKSPPDQFFGRIETESRQKQAERFALEL